MRRTFPTRLARPWLVAAVAISALGAVASSAQASSIFFVRFRPYGARGTWGAAGSALDAQPAAARSEGEHTRVAGPPTLARRPP